MKNNISNNIVPGHEEDIINITFLSLPYKFNRQLYENILELPIQLRNMIYIYCMRNFWRTYIPLTSQVPSWYEYAVYQRNLLYKARQNNIHFLHLPCNTLSEYKTYIPGCQCYHCLHEVDMKIKLDYQALHAISYLNFNDMVSNTTTIWNDKVELISEDGDGSPIWGYTIFNPQYDIEQTIYEEVSGEPINFSTGSA